MKKTLLFILLLPLLLYSAEQENRYQCTFSRSIGSEGSAPGQFSHPTGISVDPGGNIYIVDTGNNRLQKLDSQGKLLTFIGGFGWNSEQFNHPLDICTNNTINYYIADKENSRIERYDKDLNWITSFYSNEALETRLQFVFPVSLSMSIHNDLFLVDSEYKRAIMLNSQLVPVAMFGDYDWGEGALGMPVSILVTRDDMIFISDQENRCIKVFDYYGNFLYNIGKDILQTPGGLCAGPDKSIIVTDSGSNQIFFFEPAGHLLCKFGAPGSLYGAFNNPGDVAFQNNLLYVSDTGNHRIQIFQVISLEF